MSVTGDDQILPKCVERYVVKDECLLKDECDLVRDCVLL